MMILSRGLDVRLPLGARVRAASVPASSQRHRETGLAASDSYAAPAALAPAPRWRVDRVAGARTDNGSLCALIGTRRFECRTPVRAAA